jgi:Fic family protein
MAPNAAQALRLMSVVFEGLGFRSMDALIQLGGSISPSAKQTREEIVFVGGPSSSAARHIYAPHCAIPELMQGLVDGLSSRAVSDCDPVVAAATVAAFCNYMHPFKDGNGRWSRVVALSAAATGTNAWPGMTVLVFLNACRAKLTDDLFPGATVGGLRSYLAAVSSFEDALTAELESIGAFRAATAIAEMLQAAATRPAKWRLLAVDLFVSGRIEVEEIRRRAGVSKRVAEGFVDRVAGAFPQFGQKTGDGLAIGSLLKNVDNAVIAAVSGTKSI